MIKYIVVFVLCFSSFWMGFSEDSIQLRGDESVQKILEDLGDEKSPNYPNKLLVGSSAEIGESIVVTGKSRRLSGGKTMKQSKHFVCTSCHNIEQESAYLNTIDPQERLEYTAEKGLPFLQGSPLFGIVNRTEFYNNDYEKKYGDLVYPARKNIREAIQLCAVQCSQGRALKDWEIESILEYLWSIDLKLDNLILEQNEIDLLENALNKKGNKLEAIEMLKSKYLDHSPAHFVDPPEDRKMGIDSLTGNPENGKLIYENSCFHCHKKNQYSFFRLDNEKLSFRQLKYNMGKFDVRSVYQVVRYGTEPHGGKKAYMPHYPLEKMSLQQMEDLRTYIYQQAE